MKYEFRLSRLKQKIYDEGIYGKRVYASTNNTGNRSLNDASTLEQQGEIFIANFGNHHRAVHKRWLHGFYLNFFPEGAHFKYPEVWQTKAKLAELLGYPLSEREQKEVIAENSRNFQNSP